MVPVGTDVPTPIIEPLRTEQFDPIPCPHVPVDIPRVVIARLIESLPTHHTTLSFYMSVGRAPKLALRRDFI